MNIFVNNEPVTIDDSRSSISDLISYLELPDKGVAIGVNNKIVKAKDWTAFSLKEGDRVTVIKATYGG